MRREGFQQFPLAIVSRAAPGRQHRSREEARRARIEPEKVIAIDPFEIEQQRQGLAHADIRKYRTPCVEHQEFGRLRHPGLDGVADHLAAAGCREIISVVPAQRLGLDAKIVEAALERFERAVGLAIEIQPDLVEIPQAAIDRQVAAPIIGIAGQRDAGAGLHRGDAVGAGTNRRRHRGLFERRDVDRMPGQYRHQAEDQRQFAVVGAGEVEPHGEGIRCFGLGDFRIILAMVGAPLVAEQGPRKQHVLGEHRLAVREARLGIEVEGDVAPAVVGFHAPGQQAVKRKGLVIAARHQAFDHEASDLLHGEAPDDQRIEAVEGTENTLHQPAAFRRLGIGIGHMGEIGRQGRGAVHRDGMARLGRPAGVDREPKAAGQSEESADRGSNARAPGNSQRGARI